MKITFEVNKIIHHNKVTFFTIMEARIKEADDKTAKGSKQKIKGTMKSVMKGDMFEAVVEKQRHSTYGDTFQIQGVAKTTVPVTDKAITKFIEHNAKKVKGVGKKKIEAIVAMFGASTLEIIRENPLALKDCGLTAGKCLAVQEALVGHEAFEEFMTFIDNFDIPANVATEVTIAIPGINKEKVIANPYILLECDVVDFKTCDKIAMKLGIPANNDNRNRSAVMEYMIRRNESNGDICVKEEEVLDAFKSGEFLEKYGAYRTELFIDGHTVAEMIDNLKADKILTEDINNAKESFLYMTAFLYIENGIVQYLGDFKNSNGHKLTDVANVNAFIAEYEKKNFQLAKKQREAVQMVAENKISILCGGPGTGKTATTNAITQMVEAINPKATIRLLAPTGKASKRISEVTGREAQTIHRALGVKGFGNEDEDIQLADDFIVIDESSMIDAQLFYKFLKNTSTNSRILLVGDPNQLDSVGAGRILSDLIESGSIPSTTLDEVFRQSAQSQIVSNAHAIIQNKDFTNGLTANPMKGDFYFIQRATAQDIKNDIIRSIERFMKKGNELKDIMVLSAKKSGVIGTEELNRAIQAQYNPPTHFVDHEKNNGEILRVSDRVIHTVNNKDLGVFNGEIGTVKSIGESLVNGRKQIVIEVEYDDKEARIDYHGMNIEQLSLAYSITIHKSQGSEAPVVIMPVHKTQDMMLDRSLLYTGITRAKNTVVLIGEKETFNKGVGRIKSNNRTSLVKEKLANI